MREFEWIQKFVKKPSQTSVYLGAGDDCSLVQFDPDHWLLGTTDCLVENIHFRRNWMNYQEIAYKALAVNISDISAMGGRPTWAHLSLAIPASFCDVDVENFFSGFYSLAQEWEIDLVGGDIVSSPSVFFINIHLQGLVSKSSIQLRKDFESADVLFVTNSLGDSSAGLHFLEKNMEGDPFHSLIEIHKRPPILNSQAQWLAKQQGVKGMMDLSDGLLGDIQHLPNIGIEMDLENIPHSQNLLKYCESQCLDPLLFSLAGGEDYALLAGCKKEAWQKLYDDYQKEFGNPLFNIGKLSD